MKLTKPMQTLPSNFDFDSKIYRKLNFHAASKPFIEYIGQNKLGNPVLVTEFFDDVLSKRDRYGKVTARMGKSKALSAFLDDIQKRIVILSKLQHPNLSSIVQSISENGTLYVSSEPLIGRTLEKQLLDQSAFLNESDTLNLSMGLIDLLSYFHSFGLIGIEIKPSNLVLSEDEAGIKLLAHKYLSEPIDQKTNEKFASNKDCICLAKILYGLIAKSEVPAPYKELSGNFNGFPAALLETLDDLLRNQERSRIQDALAWKKSLLQKKTIKVAKVKETPVERTSFRKWLIAGCGVVFALGLAINFLGQSDTELDQPLGGTTIEQLLSVDAGEWRVEIPVKVEKVNNGEEAFEINLTKNAPEFLSLNPWFRNGLLVSAIDGQEVVDGEFLETKLNLGQNSTKEPSAISLSVREAAIPLERQVVLRPFVWREKEYGQITLREQVTNNGWQLVVSKRQADSRVPWEIGDILESEIVLGQNLDRFDQLEAVLTALNDQKNPSLSVSVRKQDGSRVVHGFPVNVLSD